MYVRKYSLDSQFLDFVSSMTSNFQDSIFHYTSNTTIVFLWWKSWEDSIFDNYLCAIHLIDPDFNGPRLFNSLFKLLNMYWTILIFSLYIFVEIFVYVAAQVYRSCSVVPSLPYSPTLKNYDIQVYIQISIHTRKT